MFFFKVFKHGVNCVFLLEFYCNSTSPQEVIGRSTMEERTANPFYRIIIGSVSVSVTVNNMNKFCIFRV